MDRKSLQELIEVQRGNRAPGAVIQVDDERHYRLNDHPYELLADYKSAFNLKELGDRFNTYYSKYDYLVGDWGFEQLRLRGFYENEQHVPAETKIEALEDFLMEKANLGCAYFVLHNLEVRQQPQKRQRNPGETNNHRRRRNRSRRSSTNKQSAHTHEAVKTPTKQPGEKSTGTVKTVGRRRRRHFTIREKKD